MRPRSVHARGCSSAAELGLRLVAAVRQAGIVAFCRARTREKVAVSAYSAFFVGGSGPCLVTTTLRLRGSWSRLAWSTVVGLGFAAAEPLGITFGITFSRSYRRHCICHQFVWFLTLASLLQALLLLVVVVGWERIGWLIPPLFS